MIAGVLTKGVKAALYWHYLSQKRKGGVQVRIEERRTDIVYGNF